MRRALQESPGKARLWLFTAVLVISTISSTDCLVGAAAGPFVGHTVTEIRLRSDLANLDLERLQPLLLVEVGASLNQEDLARSLRNLQASGLVSEVEVFVEPAEKGVVVTFVTWGRIQVEKVVLLGALEVKEKELRSVLVLHEAEPLVTSRILRGVYDLEAYYQRLGFLEASVRSKPEIDLENKTAVIAFQIDPGPRFAVQNIVFAGPTAPFEASQLQGRLRMVPGKPFRERLARADVERLETWLFSQDHRRASVGPFLKTIDWERAVVDLSYQIDVGPRFHFEIHGADQRRLQKKGMLPFLGNQRYDEAILLQSIGKIRDYYQRQGHYDVEVDWSESRSEELIHLIMTIDAGPKYELADISFQGNEAVPTYQLMSLVSTDTKRLFAARSGRLSDATLEDDIENILSYYRLQGYWDAEVGPPEVTESEGRLSVVVPVAEGLERRLVNLDLDGLDSVDEAQLRDRLPLRPGGPFHPVLLDETISAIRAYYRSQGFESIQMSSEVDWNRQETLADVTLRILEGPRSLVDRVVVRGNQRTRSKSIRDALNLRSGEYISTGRLLEAQNNLYKLGAFSSVSVRRAPGTPFKGERDILVEVEEGSRHTITYGFGVDTEDGFTGLFGYTRSNMFGRGVSGRVDLRAGQDSLARLLLYQPFLGRRRITTTGSLFYIEETREAFESLRRGGQIELQRIGDSSRTGVLFDYRLVDQLDLVSGVTSRDMGDPADRDLEEVQIASLTPNWQLNHRNHPVDPTSGWSTNLQIQYAFPLFQSQEEFLKSFVQYTQFFDLGWLGSVGGSFRVGGIEPFKTGDEDRDPDFPVDQPSQFIPISERYFAGGSTTHRAYKRDRLGICGETLKPVVADEDALAPGDDGCDEAIGYLPLGGNGQLLLNVDYRFPIAGPFLGNVFVDAGNVWGNWRDVNLSEMKTGLGVGVRYLSPVGPIRLEAGWKLDRLPGEDPYVIFFSVGNAF